MLWAYTDTHESSKKDSPPAFYKGRLVIRLIKEMEWVVPEGDIYLGDKHLQVRVALVAHYVSKSPHVLVELYPYEQNLKELELHIAHLIEQEGWRTHR